jgi:hypothetical protein
MTSPIRFIGAAVACAIAALLSSCTSTNMIATPGGGTSLPPTLEASESFLVQEKMRAQRAPSRQARASRSSARPSRFDAGARPSVVHNLSGGSAYTPRSTRNTYAQSSKIHRKLDEIIIPRIAFEEVDVAAIVQYLKQRSKELDPDGEGVNIIFLEPKDGTVIEPDEIEGDLEDVDFDDFDINGAGADTKKPAKSTKAEKRATSKAVVSMDGENMPLGEIIRYLCQGAGLKYKVEPYSVVVAADGVIFQDLETRVYPVNSRFF